MVENGNGKDKEEIIVEAKQKELLEALRILITKDLVEKMTIVIKPNDKK